MSLACPSCSILECTIPPVDPPSVEQLERYIGAISAEHSRCGHELLVGRGESKLVVGHRKAAVVVDIERAIAIRHEAAGVIALAIGNRSYAGALAGLIVLDNEGIVERVLRVGNGSALLVQCRGPFRRRRNLRVRRLLGRVDAEVAVASALLVRNCSRVSVLAGLLVLENKGIVVRVLRVVL